MPSHGTASAHRAGSDVRTHPAAASFVLPMKMTSVRTATALKLLIPVLLWTGFHSATAATLPATQNSDQQAPDPSILPEQLRAAASDPMTRRFYEANGWRAVWSGAAERALEHSLGERARHGLDRRTFIENSTSPSAAEREVALTRAALAYATALARGATDPSKLHAIYTLPRPDADLAKPLAEAIAENRLEVWLASLAPQDDVYARLSEAYLAARSQSGGDDQVTIAAGIIRVGDTDTRVPAIVADLVGADYLTVDKTEAPAQALDTNRYTQRIATAVKGLQRDYGISADGVIGPATLEILNLRPGDRAVALAVALERLRWLARTPPATRIDVNTAAAQLSYYRDGKLVDTRRVIVGQPGKETPQLLAPMFRLVANPTWTIPKSIQHGEMAGVSAAYLRRRNMVRSNGWIVQRPGPNNALGLVKFDMHDEYAIYLHDTSAPALFARSARYLSHGCVRVEDALGFAQRIAEDEGIADQWQRAQTSGKYTLVPLPKQIPVRLLYQNAFVETDGSVAYRTDPYGWNAPIAQALGFGERSTVRARSAAVDVGP